MFSSMYQFEEIMTHITTTRLDIMILDQEILSLLLGSGLCSSAWFKQHYLLQRTKPNLFDQN